MPIEINTVKQWPAIARMLQHGGISDEAVKAISKIDSACVAWTGFLTKEATIDSMFNWTAVENATGLEDLVGKLCSAHSKLTNEHKTLAYFVLRVQKDLP